MTNYLDELLEQQEQEEAGGLMEFRKRRAYGAEPRGAVRTDYATQAAPAARLEDAVLQVGEQAQGAAQLLRQVQQLHRAVRQVGEQGRRTAPSQTAAQWDAGGGRHGTVLPSRRTADYAAAVDMAFQRDARRYDGPMELPR